MFRFHSMNGALSPPVNGGVLRMYHLPGRVVRHPERNPPSRNHPLAAHNEAIYDEELGLTSKEMTALSQAGVI